MTGSTPAAALSTVELRLKRGFVVVVSGPGGVGKNTLVSAVRRRMPAIQYSISVTTRPPRRGEVDSRDYFFVTPERFHQMVEKGELLEWANFAGHWYGTPARFVEQALASGQVILLDIDIQGARQLRGRLPDGVFVFLMPPSLQALRERLVRRGTDDLAAIERRMALALTEIQSVHDYDYVILNEGLEEATRQLEAVIRAEACRLARLDIFALGPAPVTSPAPAGRDAPGAPGATQGGR